MIPSVIDDFYDKLQTMAATAFEDHDQLTDAFDIQNNSDLKLKLGYGIDIRSGNRQAGALDCDYALEKVIVITNTIENPGTDKDIVKRKVAEKALLNAQINMIKQAEVDPNVVASCDKFEYSGDNGIEETFTEKKRFLMIQTTFNLILTKNRS